MMYALRYPRFVKAFSTLDYETADGSLCIPQQQPHVAHL